MRAIRLLACASGLYCFCTAFLVLAISFTGATSAQTTTLTFKNNETTSGTIRKFADGKIVIETADEERSFEFDELKWIDFGDSAPATGTDSLTAIAEFLDGSTAKCKEIGLSKRLLKLETGCGAELEFDGRQVRSIRFATDASATDLKFWQQISRPTEPVSSDLLVVKREGKLSEVEGVIQAISDKEVSFTIGDRTADVKRSKIFGLVFYRNAKQESNSIAVLNLNDGSKFLASNIVRFENDELLIEATAGTSLSFKLADLAKIDFGSLSENFLSDLEPTTIDWQPLIKSTASMQMRSMKLPRFNTGFLKRPLSLNALDVSQGVIERREFAKGIAMPGGSKVAFDLGKRFKSLTGVVGFDSNASPAGKVTLIVSGDGKTILREDMVNDREQQPLELDLQIGSVGRLVIEVGYNDGRPIGDLLNLCDLKLVK